MQENPAKGPVSSQKREGWAWGEKGSEKRDGRVENQGCYSPTYTLRIVRTEWLTWWAESWGPRARVSSWPGLHFFSWGVTGGERVFKLWEEQSSGKYFNPKGLGVSWGGYPLKLVTQPHLTSLAPACLLVLSLTTGSSFLPTAPCCPPAEQPSSTNTTRFLIA